MEAQFELIKNRKQCILPTIILTGAPTSGKTTIQNHLIELGWRGVAIDTTRKPRDLEQDGVHFNFISVKEFRNKYDQELYIPGKNGNIEDLEYNGNYYGALWQYAELTSCVLVPTSPIFALKIKQKSKHVFWLHLHADENTRRQRLSQRPGITKDEVEYRLINGASHQIPEEADLVLDTSVLNACEIIKNVLQFLFLS